MNELPHMIGKELCQERQKQAEICIDLQQYRQGAKVMLHMKKLFNLQGDFTDMEQIIASVSLWSWLASFIILFFVVIYYNSCIEYC